MYLSKAFDTINHELLIAKLHAYDFVNSALKLLLHYLSNRWKRSKKKKEILFMGRINAGCTSAISIRTSAI